VGFEPGSSAPFSWFVQQTWGGRLGTSCDSFSCTVSTDRTGFGGLGKLPPTKLSLDSTS
jgi:hypothetical protein